MKHSLTHLEKLQDNDDFRIIFLLGAMIPVMF